MSKTISTQMSQHLGLEVTSLATCWRITRQDGVQFFFTDHDSNISFGGDTYLAQEGYERTAIQNDSELSVDNLNVIGLLASGSITEQDLRAGKFDFAQAQIFLVNWEDPDGFGDIKLRSGRFGEVQLTQQGTFQVELRGLTQLLSQKIGEVYQPECRADLGDSRCKVPIDPPVRQNSTAYSVGDFIRVATAAGSTQSAYENRIYECTTAGTTAGTPPTYNTTPGATTNDGTAVFTTRQAWMRHGVVDSVTNRSVFTLTVAFDETRAVDDWFNGGALEFEDGDNAGRVIEIRDWIQSSRTVELFLPASYNIASGALVRLYPGCDKRATTCEMKFFITGSFNFNDGNIKNFRGEPFVPGQDQLTRYPDARSA